MSNTTLNLNDQLYDYLLSVSLREAEVLKALREETAKLPEHNMQISPEQGQFMRLLVRNSLVQKRNRSGRFYRL